MVESLDFETRHLGEVCPLLLIRCKLLAELLKLAVIFAMAFSFFKNRVA